MRFIYKVRDLKAIEPIGKRLNQLKREDKMKTLAKLAILIIFSLTLQLAQTNQAQAYGLCGHYGQPPCPTTPPSGTNTAIYGGYHPAGGGIPTPGDEFGCTIALVNNINYEIIVRQQVFQDPYMAETQAPIKLVLDCPDPEYFCGDDCSSPFISKDSPFFRNEAAFMLLICTETDGDCYTENMTTLSSYYSDNGYVGGIDPDCPCGEQLNDTDDDVQHYAWTAIMEQVGDEETPHYYCLKRIETDEIKMLLEKDVVDAAYRAAKDTGEEQILVDNCVQVKLVPAGDKVSLVASRMKLFNLETEETIREDAGATIDDVSDVIEPEEEEHHHHHHHHHHKWLKKWFKKLQDKWDFHCPIEF